MEPKKDLVDLLYHVVGRVKKQNPAALNQLRKPLLRTVSAAMLKHFIQEQHKAAEGAELQKTLLFFCSAKNNFFPQKTDKSLELNNLVVRLKTRHLLEMTHHTQSR